MRSKVRGLRAIERRVLEDRRQTAALAPCPSYETPPADDTPPTDLPAVATPEAWAGRDLGGGRTDSALDATGWAVPSETDVADEAGGGVLGLWGGARGVRHVEPG